MNYLYSDTVIQIFCKAPVPGTVKTRLMTALTAEQAADVHKQLSRRTFELVGSSELCAMQIWCCPDIEDEFFTQAATEFDASLHLQQGKDLGQRMHHAISSGLEHYQHVILIGCDCPSLSTADLQDAIKALRGEDSIIPEPDSGIIESSPLNNQADVVLAPAEDGGYVLLGLKQPELSLFSDMQWGVSSVLQITRERIQAAQLELFELKEQWDVDTPEDLERWLLR